MNQAQDMDQSKAIKIRGDESSSGDESSAGDEVSAGDELRVSTGDE